MKRIKSFISVLMSVVMTIAVSSVSVLAASPALIDNSRSVTVNIHKYDLTEQQLEDLKSANVHDTGEQMATPPSYNGLAGVKFSYYQVGSIGETEEYIKNNTSSVSGITRKFEVGSDGLPVSGCYAHNGQTGETNASGETNFVINNDGSGTQMGLYYVVETQAPEKVTVKTESFFAYLPMTVQNKNAWNYNVHLYPKNATSLGAVVLSKKVDNGKALPANVIAQFKLQYRAIDATDPTPWQYIKGADGQDKIYETINGGSNHGKLAVNGLLVNQYQFIEVGVYDVDSSGGKTLSKLVGINDTPIPFTINKGDTGHVDDSTFAETGTVYHVNANDYTIPDPNKKIQVDATTAVEHNGYRVGDTVPWIISSNIPLDITHYTAFVISDTIDSKLTYTNDNDVVVKAGDTPLTRDTQYKLNYNGDNKTLKITFIDPDDSSFVAGKTALDAAVQAASPNVANVTVLFKTKVNEDGINAVIPNKATLSFNNNYGTNMSKETNEPEVHYNGAKFIKQDSNNAGTKLDGAEFTIYKTEADARAGSNPIKTAASSGGGYFQFTGLEYGGPDVAYNDPSAKTTYYMVETKAPAGYQLVNSIFSVEIYHDSYATTSANPIVIKNNSDTVLPLTGGIGTVIFTVLGIALIVGACILLIKFRKTKSEK